MKDDKDENMKPISILLYRFNCSNCFIHKIPYMIKKKRRQNKNQNGKNFI